MSKSIQIIDIIKASTGNDPIQVQSIESYTTSYDLADFGDNDQINKRAALQIGTGIPQIVPVITAGTSIPFFVDISLYTGAGPNTDVITKATSYDPATGIATGRLQRWYDMPTEEQDTVGDGTGDFTGWNIYGHDDGSGNFKEDTTVILKG